MSTKELKPINFKDSWLSENIDYLVGDLGCSLNILDSEQEKGFFSIDMFCEDEEGNSTILKYDLDEIKIFLGQVMTYAAGSPEKTVIWITPNPTDKHYKLIEWLNSETPDAIRWYLFKAEGSRVGNAPPTPIFTKLAGHTKEDDVEKCRKNNESAQCHKRLQWWEILLRVVNEKTDFYKKINFTKNNWIGSENDISGLYYQLVVDINNGLVRVVQCF